MALFPSDTSQSPWTNPDDGVVYDFIDGIWVPQSTGSGGDSSGDGSGGGSGLYLNDLEDVNTLLGVSEPDPLKDWEVYEFRAENPDACKTQINYNPGPGEFNIYSTTSNTTLTVSSTDFSGKTLDVLDAARERIINAKDEILGPNLSGSHGMSLHFYISNSPSGGYLYPAKVSNMGVSGNLRTFYFSTNAAGKDIRDLVLGKGTLYIIISKDLTATSANSTQHPDQLWWPSDVKVLEFDWIPGRPTGAAHFSSITTSNATVTCDPIDRNGVSTEELVSYIVRASQCGGNFYALASFSKLGSKNLVQVGGTSTVNFDIKSLGGSTWVSDQKANPELYDSPLYVIYSQNNKWWERDFLVNNKTLKFNSQYNLWT